MNPQERQLVDELFDRLAKLEAAPRDPDAANAISDGLRKAPNAVYPLVQTVLLQDEALKRANSHIQELEAALQQPQQQQSGGFLDSMRDAIFGQGQGGQSQGGQPPRGSVPNVPPPASRPVWNSGQVMQQAQPPSYNQGYDHGYGQGYGQGGYQGYGQPYGASYGAPPFGGGGGSFLGTAAAAAAGLVGGSLLMSGIRNMMGGSHYGFAEPTRVVEVDRPSPWSDQSGSTLARDAGVNDIGSSRDFGDSSSRSGLLDQASDNNNFGGNDRDDMDMDADDFTDNGGDFGNDDGSQDV
jgi:hypothetical protein